jgi:hypothetical protein
MYDSCAVACYFSMCYEGVGHVLAYGVMSAILSMRETGAGAEKYHKTL